MVSSSSTLCDLAHTKLSCLFGASVADHILSNICDSYGLDYPKIANEEFETVSKELERLLCDMVGFCYSSKFLSDLRFETTHVTHQAPVPSQPAKQRHIFGVRHWIRS